MTLVIIGLITLIGGAFISSYILRGKNLINFEKKEQECAEMIKTAQEESEEIKSKAAEQVDRYKKDLAENARRKEERIGKIEISLKNKEEFLKKKEERNQDIKLKLASLKEETQSLEHTITRNSKWVIDQLTEKTGSTTEELKETLLESYKKELELNSAEKLVRSDENLKENAEKIAKRIIVEVIQRVTSDTSVERRAIMIEVPKDHIKGKIVGKDGMNIKAFEAAINVDVVFNDMPNVISISAFNMVDRRIANVAMEKLVRIKGEITPEIVTRTVKLAERETDEELFKIGREALRKMGIEHKDQEFIRTVGRLQYRTSYGQNIMKHSMEVGWICRMLGAEIGLNERTCLIAGFLHDIGKAIDQDPNQKDCHDALTKEIMDKHGFSWEEVHAAWVHHDAEPQQTAEAFLVKAADAISAARPGARQESFEKYLERVQDIERTAIEFEGVKRAFAISAGREVRVVVDPDKMDDGSLPELARKVAKKIEEDITYPGKIKVNVIRRTKYTETSK